MIPARQGLTFPAPATAWRSQPLALRRCCVASSQPPPQPGWVRYCCQDGAASGLQPALPAQLGMVPRLVPAGEISIAPIAEEDVGAAAVVLTRAFADSPEALSYSDVSKFLTSILSVPPDKAQVLVARLAPTGAALQPS